MRRARDVDEHAVRRIGRHQRRIFHAPQRKADQRGLVLVRRRIDDAEIGHERLRMRHRHAAAKPEPLGSFIDARQHAALALHDRRHERLIPRGQVVALPPQPVARPARQEERDNPSHRTPPKSKNAARHHGRAAIRPASAGAAARRSAVGGEGCGETRQRVAAALGSPASCFSVVLRQRRIDERRDAGLARAELQAARGVQRQPRDFADDAREPLAAQAFLHRGQAHRASFQVSQ